MKNISRKTLNIICSVLWFIVFLMGIPVIVKDPRLVNFLLEALSLILVVLFGLAAYGYSKHEE